MQGIHITCIPERLMLLVEELEVQLKAVDGVELLDFGHSCKQNQGYVVLEWVKEADEAFVSQLDADEIVVDYCVYTIPQLEDLPFGAELTIIVSDEEEEKDDG